MAKRESSGHAAYSRMLWIALVFSGGCEFVPGLEGKDSKIADGERCDKDEDCESDVCTTAQLCAHSPCRCTGDACGPTGQESSACSDGWVCTDATNGFDNVREFFGGEAPEDRGYCQPTCEATCPEHYVCQGMFCSPTTDWANPIPTIAWLDDSVSGNGQSKEVELEVGSTVTLRASASSPTDAAITRYSWTWTTNRASGEQEGTELDLTLDAEAGFLRAQLLVTDERSRSSLVDVRFSSCLGAGATCGYEGSGCCKGCDRTANACM
jgi:hypothetical protein